MASATFARLKCHSAHAKCRFCSPKVPLFDSPCAFANAKRRPCQQHIAPKASRDSRHDGLRHAPCLSSSAYFYALNVLYEPSEFPRYCLIAADRPRKAEYVARAHGELLPHIEYIICRVLRVDKVK